MMRTLLSVSGEFGEVPSQNHAPGRFEINSEGTLKTVKVLKVSTIPRQDMAIGGAAVSPDDAPGLVAAAKAGVSHSPSRVSGVA